MKNPLISITLLLAAQIASSQVLAKELSCPAGLDCTQGNVLLTSESTASIYVDGQYTGQKTPAMLNLSNDKHIVGVGLDQERVYYRKEITTTDQPSHVHLTAKDQPTPATWKALFVGVPHAFGKSGGKTCSTHFDKQDLDKAFEFFKFNMRAHIEPYSYGTVQWEIERRDLSVPVELSYNPENQWYTLEAEQGLAELDNVNPGKYDTVFYFWREEQADCSFKSGYFGLAWLDPTADESRQTGYVTVKFNPGTIGVGKTLAKYKNNDPGVWTHEWLHVVIEQFYPNRDVKVPLPPKDKLILHAAEAYGYQYPWLDWYKDLISGQVPFGKTFTGIGPEALLACTIVDAAKGKC
ncbi:MAG: hypothetical protein ACI8WB_005735 [Phenylobacterium sp.]|jgi:hypothetical protein